MAYLVVLILDDPDHCAPILDVWEAAGVKGITILKSSGLGRVRRAALRDDLPLMPSLRNLLEGEHNYHRTLFSVVKTQQQVGAMIESAQSVVGNFDQPNTGLLFVVPLVQVYGNV